MEGSSLPLHLNLISVVNFDWKVNRLELDPHGQKRSSFWKAKVFRYTPFESTGQIGTGLSKRSRISQ
jgi:hypothetical protein